MKHSKQKKEVFSVTIDPGVMKIIDDIADENVRSRSNQVELALKYFLRETSKQ